MAINVTSILLDVPLLQEKYPDFKAVSNCDREKIRPEMEVLLRSRGEDFRAKVEEVNEDNIIGKVLKESFYFSQPFKYLDLIEFEKKNVINIFVINGVYY